MKLICLLSLLCVASLLRAQVQNNRGTALAVNVSGRMATVSVNAGVRQVVLEQLSGQGWKPLAVAHPTRSGRLNFTVPAGTSSQSVRAVAFSASKFPSRFRSAPRRFDRRAPGTAPLVLSGNSIGGDRVVSLANGQVLRSTDRSNNPVAPAQLSDIWQIRGERVFFFNQYRGLQVLDVTEPMQPTRLGTLRLAASGDQMFVLDEQSTKLALLGRSNDPGAQGQACIWTVSLDERGAPALASSLQLRGNLLDSRLIGSTLHVLSVEWGVPSAANGMLTVQGGWGCRTLLSSVDLAAPAKPRLLGTLTWEGAYSAVMQDAGDCLLLATTTSGASVSQQSQLHVLDLNTEAPTLRKSFGLRGGWVQDKFKLGRIGDSVVAVTQDFVSMGWSSRQTWVETFALQGESTQALASLEIEAARGETLYATRFDGDRLYVVTFLQVDPLFVVDLSDPAQPQVRGELKIPGFSTYIEPLGDRLLTVGVEDRHVTIKLFDVADPASPQQTAKLSLGADNAYSWSEANYDEKAVAWLPEQGLLMVPFQSGWGDTAQKAIQVVHVSAEGLQAGATLEHEFAPRRGSLINGHLVSISGQQLKVQGADEAHAQDKASLTLAWPVDRVLSVGDWLIQVEDGPLPNWNFWGLTRMIMPVAQYGRAKLRWAPASDPDALVREVDLGQGAVVSCVHRGSKLNLAVWAPASPDGATPERLRTLVLDLSSSDPVVALAGEVSHDLSKLSSQSLRLDAVDALNVADDKLAWFVPARVNFWGGYCIAIMPVLRLVSPVQNDMASTPVVSRLASAAVSSAVSPNPVSIDPDWAQPSGQWAGVLLPVKFSQQGAEALPPCELKTSAGLLQVSSAQSSAGFVFISHDVTTSKDVVVPQSAAQPVGALSKLTGGKMATRAPIRRRESRVESWLQVVDWRGDALVLRDPVSVPGQLVAVAQADDQGAVLLTQSDRQLGSQGQPVRELQASAYDGVSAWQLSSYVTATGFFSATASDGVRLYLVRDQEAQPGVEAIGYNSGSGRLARVGQWSTSRPANLLSVVSSHLLASSYGNLEVAEIVDRPSISGQLLQPRAAYDLPSNLWLRVDRAFWTPDQGLWVPAGDYGVELLRPRQTP